MKKIIFPCMLVLTACNNNQPSADAPAKQGNIPAVEQVDNSPQAYFKSNGFASKSMVEIISNADGSFLVKYSVDGASAETSMRKEPLVVDGKPNVGTGEVKLKGDEAKLSIAPGKCDGGTHVC
ncbi:MAG: hypothetical protein ACKOSR_01140, partial [Flavobacteriales bacterium]